MCRCVDWSCLSQFPGYVKQTSCYLSFIFSTQVWEWSQSSHLTRSKQVRFFQSINNMFTITDKQTYLYKNWLYKVFGCIIELFRCSTVSRKSYLTLYKPSDSKPPHFTDVITFSWNKTERISCLHNPIRPPRLQTRPPRQWIWGEDLSLVVVGRSFTVANGFVPLKQEDDGQRHTTPHTQIHLMYTHKKRN